MKIPDKKIELKKKYDVKGVRCCLKTERLLRKAIMTIMEAIMMTTMMAIPLLISN